MASVVQLPSGRFRAFARVGGMKAAQTFDRKKEAEVWADSTEQRMRAGKWVAPKAKKREAQKTVREAFAAYVESEEWERKAEVTKRVELAKQRPVIDALGSKRLNELTSDDVRGYIAQRRKTRPSRGKQNDSTAYLSPDQIRLEVAALSAMCNYAVERHWVESNPTRGVKRPQSNRRTVRIDDELIGKILTHQKVRGDLRAALFFRLLFSTACRPGELASAKKEWFTLDPPKIRIPVTKNQDERDIIIPNSMALHVYKFIDMDDTNSPYIFSTWNRRNKTFAPFNYASIWRVVSKDLQLKRLGIVPHVARHEAISRLFERTELSDGQIATISGHRTAQALWRYKHLRAEHVRGIVNSLDNIIFEAADAAINNKHKKLFDDKSMKMIKPTHPPLDPKPSPKEQRQRLRGKFMTEIRVGGIGLLYLNLGKDEELVLREVIEELGLEAAPPRKKGEVSGCVQVQNRKTDEQEQNLSGVSVQENHVRK
ncbi:MAG: tyrosine-type recombinase/integrase [Thiomonas sp.]